LKDDASLAKRVLQTIKSTITVTHGKLSQPESDTLHSMYQLISCQAAFVFIY